MAIIVLLSTMSFTVEEHFCGDFLVDVSYVGSAKKCNDVSGDFATIKKKNCCKDEVHHIEGQDELQNDPSSKFTFEQQKIITAFTCSFLALFGKFKLKKEFYKDFLPPDLNKDIQVLYQTFLI